MYACTVMKLRGNYARMFNEVYFCEGFEEILHYGMMRCRVSDVCGCVLAWHLLLGTPRASKFGKCEPWYIAWRLFSKKIQKSQNGIFVLFSQNPR